MKKILSIILVLIMTLSVIPVLADEGCQIVLAKQNETENGFDVLFSIKNNPGMAAITLQIDFDKDCVTPKSIVKAGIFSNQSITTNLDKGSGNSVEDLEFVKVVWYKLSGLTGDGDMFKISFDYKSVATEKETSVSVAKKKLDIIDKNAKQIEYTSNVVNVVVPADENAVPPTVDPEPETPPTTDPTPSTPSGPSYRPPVVENKVTLENKKGVSKIKYIGLYEDNTFAPSKPATRYEVVEALNNLIDITATKYKDAFKDVEEKYEKTVKAFITAEILDGYEDGTFRGNATITRAELVKILTIAFKLEEDKDATAEFTDIKGHWAESYIKTFVSNKYTFGYEDNTFRPENEVTRAEVVAFVNRIIKAEGELSTNIPTDLTTDHWAYSDILKAIK